MANPLDDLARHFQKLPSVGARSAQRMAFFILSQSNSWVDSFISSLKEVKEKIRYCSNCYNITIQDPCSICADQSRDKSLLCVLADPKDQIAIERTREFKGLYHILGGLISPIEGITPDILKIDELVNRISREKFSEIFFAINPTVEGEATILYITNLVKKYNIKMTRIAYGLPIGANIDYADELTIQKAYEGRIEI